MKSSERLAGLTRRYGVQAGSEALARFRLYPSLLCRWNSRMNLTASTDWDLLGPLFEEALWAARLYPQDRLQHLDFGSGAGFPALAMKIMLPSMTLDLVESRRKKSVFLETVIRELGLQNAAVHCRRLGQYLVEEGARQRWDCVSWKGIRPSDGEMNLLLESCKAGTRMWIFHGRELPVQGAASFNRRVELQWREPCPCRREWFLSLYAMRERNCFT